MPIKKISAVFLWFCVFFIGSEVAFRLIKNHFVLRMEWQMNDIFHYPKPYVMAVADPQRAPGHNVLGYNDDLPAIPKPPDEFRVFILGGSTVHFGEPAPFSRMLNAKNLKHGSRNIKFYNFGITSSVSRQDLVRLLIDLPSYQPDMILHYGGGNDFTAVDPRINYPHRFVFYEKSLLFDLRSSWQGTLMFLVTRSELLKAVFRIPIEKFYLHDVDFLFKDKENRPLYQAAAFWQNLSWMQYLARIQGVNYLAILQPMLAYKNHLADKEKDMISSHARELTQSQRQIFRKLAQSPVWNVAFSDCSEIFNDTQEEIFIDQIHVNSVGQEKAMNCIVYDFQKHLDPKTTAPSDLKPVQIPEHIFVVGQKDFKAWLEALAKVKI